ncbi:hypothetical protein [Candidatus Spongiihabitans sp.]|uniref:hypothetical protein n=1 Tax=Candidatus Spongiihabitans sp. TaxID=3101308 RepID=UPI003C7EC856
MARLNPRGDAMQIQLLNRSAAKPPVCVRRSRAFFSFAFGVSKEIIAFRFTIVSPTRHCPAHIIIGRAIQ